jgi:hypothetical protein
MSNHLHVVLYENLEKAQGWSDKQESALWHTSIQQRINTATHTTT